MSPIGYGKLLESFDLLCAGQMTCEFKIQYSWFNKQCRERLDYYATHSKYKNFTDILQWDDRYLRDARVREPVLFATAFCVADEIMSSSGESTGIIKSSFIYVILILDFLVVFLMICFINLLEKRYLEYAE